VIPYLTGAVIDSAQVARAPAHLRLALLIVLAGAVKGVMMLFAAGWPAALAGRRVRPAKPRLRAPAAALLPLLRRHQTGQLMSRATSTSAGARVPGLRPDLLLQNVFTVVIVLVALSLLTCS